MRRSGVLFSQKEARAQQIPSRSRAAAETALRGAFAAHVRPPRRGHQEDGTV